MQKYKLIYFKGSNDRTNKNVFKKNMDLNCKRIAKLNLSIINFFLDLELSF